MEFHVRVHRKSVILILSEPQTNFLFAVDDEDIDGIPLDTLESSKPLGQKASRAFIPSKWETVEPEQIEAQAVTISKWDTLDPVAPEPPKFYDSDDSGRSDNDFDQSR